MFKSLLIFMVIALSAFAFSCSSQGEEETIIPFEVIHGGPFASVSAKKEMTAANQDDYLKIMNEVYANLDQMPQIPEVDFTKNDVVAVFMGAKTTGGYSINVDKVIKRKDALTVAVNETSPAANCVVTQAITQPFQVIKIPKTKQKIVYVFKQRTNECK
jgi:hypothetical protein